MKLNYFTDFSMRILMYLNQKNDTRLSSLDDLTKKFNISRNHLIKVVQFLASNNLVATKRGVNGGITIAKKAQEIRLGDLIHLLEQDSTPIINCNTKPCIFKSHDCKLKYSFEKAYQAFISSLNENMLADLKFNHWENIF